MDADINLLLYSLPAKISKTGDRTGLDSVTLAYTKRKQTQT